MPEDIMKTKEQETMKIPVPQDRKEEKSTRLRIIYLYKLLLDQADEEHPLSTKQIIENMQTQYGIYMHRTTVASDIALLIEAGFDVVKVRTRSWNYYLADRAFSLPELKVVIDAVQSSKFITEKKSHALIEKLAMLTDKENAQKLKRTIHISDRAKSENEKGYYIVDAINEAINIGVKISFCYFDYDKNKKQILKNNGEPYTVSPYDLIWDGDYYYLTGFCDERNAVRVFRVDRICRQPELLHAARRKPPRRYSVKKYTTEVFRMFDTQALAKVVLHCDNTMMRSIIDRFGMSVQTEELDNDRFQAKVNVCLGPTFYSWVFGFDDLIRIAGPEEAVNGYKAMLQRSMEGLEYDELRVSVSPRQLGTADSVEELVDLIKDHVVDCRPFAAAPTRIMETNEAADFISQLENIPDMEQIKSVTIDGWEQGRYNLEYYQSFSYDRETEQYTYRRRGKPFEKDGGSGGELRFSDALDAVDERSLETFVFTEGVRFLSFRNREFVTTGLSDAQKERVYSIVFGRGGYINDAVTDNTYCLIVNENYGRTTNKYRFATYNRFTTIIRLSDFYKLAEQPLEPDQPFYRIREIPVTEYGRYIVDVTKTRVDRFEKILVDVHEEARELDLLDVSLFDFAPFAFKGCTKMKTLRMNCKQIGGRCFSDCPLTELELGIMPWSFTKKVFENETVPYLILPMEMLDKQNSMIKQGIINGYLRADRNGDAIEERLRQNFDDYISKQRKCLYSSESHFEYMLKYGLIPPKEAVTLAEDAAIRGDTEREQKLRDYLASGKKPKSKAKSMTTAEDKLWSTKKMPDGTLGLRLYKGLETDVVAPVTLKGCSVSAVLSKAFSPLAKGLTEEQIEARKKLRSVIFPEGIVTFENNIFFGCTNIEEVSFPDSMDTSRSIPNPGLEDCINLKVFRYPDRPPYGMFSYMPFREFTIPDQATKIQLFGWKHLQAIHIPSGVTDMSHAFTDCTALAKVSFSEGLKEISNYAFSGCSSLTDIQLPASLTKVGWHAFSGCTSLRSIVIPENVQEIDGRAFEGCKSLGSIVIPESVQKIAFDAFWGCYFPVIHAKLGSYAHSYAKEQGIKVQLIDETNDG